MRIEYATLLDPALLERIKGLSLVARRLVEGSLHGLHRSPLRGLSIEFAQHREYSPGDELKHLDWQVLARSDRYVLKQYEQETNLRAVLFLDCSRSMAFGDDRLETTKPAGDRPAQSADHDHDSPPLSGPPDTESKFHYARVLAAALAYLMLHQGDSVGLMLTAEEIRRQVPPRASAGHIMSICHTLAQAEPEGRTNLVAVMGQLAARLKRRSLVILISDLLDEPERLLSALGQLSHRGHDVMVFQVLDQREISFDLGFAAHGITVIRDMETGDEFEAEPNLVRDLVKAEVRRFLDQLDDGARRHGLHLVRCPTSRPVDQVLTEYLHLRLKSKRGGG